MCRLALAQICLKKPKNPSPGNHILLMSSSIVLLFITSYQLFFSLRVISLDPREEINCCCAPESIGLTELEGGKRDNSENHIRSSRIDDDRYFLKTRASFSTHCPSAPYGNFIPNCSELQVVAAQRRAGFLSLFYYNPITKLICAFARRFIGYTST